MADDIRQPDLREEPSDAPRSGPELTEIRAQGALLVAREDELAYPCLRVPEASRIADVLPAPRGRQERIEVEARRLAQRLGRVGAEDLGERQAVTARSPKGRRCSSDQARSRCSYRAFTTRGTSCRRRAQRRSARGRCLVCSARKAGATLSAGIRLNREGLLPLRFRCAGAGDAVDLSPVVLPLARVLLLNMHGALRLHQR